MTSVGTVAVMLCPWCVGMCGPDPATPGGPDFGADLDRWLGCLDLILPVERTTFWALLPTWDGCLVDLAMVTADVCAKNRGAASEESDLPSRD